MNQTESDTPACSRCQSNEQLPTGTLCIDCVRDDIEELEQ